MQLLETLDQFAKQVSDAVGFLSNQHTFFLRRDTKNIPPKSSIETMTLKLMIRNEPLQQFHQKHNQLINSINHKLEEVSRTISHIDQTLEFNLEASLNLFRQNNVDNSVSQARRIALDGLSRVLEMNESLISECEFLERLTREKLLDNTQIFQQVINRLRQNTYIFSLRSKINRAQKYEQFKVMWQRLFTLIKSVFSIIFLEPFTRLLNIKIVQLRRRSFL